MKQKTADRIAGLEDEVDRQGATIANITVELVKARRAIRQAIENCSCEGVACDRCRPLLAVAVEIGCW